MIKNLKPQLFISLLLILSPFFVLADNSCQNDCSFWGQYQCQGVSGKNCGNYDNNSCLTWSPWQKCDSRCYFCGDKTCDSQCGEDYSNCSKDCKYPNPLPVVEAGINIEVWEGASVTLEGSASDPEGETLKYSWSCNGGQLTNQNTLTPTFFAPEVSQDRNFFCTLKVEDFRGGVNSDSVNIKVKKRIPTLTVEKLARNISQNQTSWQNISSARPSDRIEFKIEVIATTTTDTYNILAIDVLPAGIVYEGNLKIDGNAASGDLIKTLKLGDLAKGKSKIITFEAQLLPENYFTQGTTALTNIVQVRANYMPEVSDSAHINVIKPPYFFSLAEAETGNDSSSGQSTIQATVTDEQTTATNGVVKKSILGTATQVSTGITNGIFESFLLPLVIALITIFVFKSQIIWLDECLDKRREKIRKYMTEKNLKRKTQYFKSHEKELYETWNK